MDVIVNVQGKGGGPLGGSPASVEVRVDDWRGMPHKTDALVADVTVQACEAYERIIVLEMARADRRKVETRPEGEYEILRRLAGFYGPWREWSDEAVYTPAMLGPLAPFLENVSAALGQPDGDWIGDRSDLTILEAIAGRVAEITDALAALLTPEQLAEFDERYGTFFTPDDSVKAWVDVPDGGEVLLPGGSVKITGNVTTFGPEGVKTREIDGPDLEAIREHAPEVPILPDPGEPHYGNVGSLEVRRCARIGEHEPHTWGAEGTYHCQGEVF